MHATSELTPASIHFAARDVLRRLLAIVMPMLGLLLVGIFLLHSRDRDRDRQLARKRSVDAVRLHGRIVERELEAARALLLHVVEQDMLRGFLTDPRLRAPLEREYVRLCRTTGILDQVRVLDIEGLETLRVDLRTGEAAPEPPHALQSKADRYYVRKARELSPGEVYISPFDLNLEHGRIEEPWKPVLRLVTPACDRSGERRGSLVFNYLGARLLDRLDDAAKQGPGQVWLVDGDGYYLQGPDATRSWGFMFGKEPTFAGEHRQAWDAIRREPEGSLSTEDGMLTFAPVELIGAPEGQHGGPLVVVCFVPSSLVHAASSRAFERLVVGAGIVALTLVGIAWRLAFVAAVRERQKQGVAASEGRLRVLSRQLLAAQETERKSIARDLHDEIGQLATSTMIDLKRARSSKSDATRTELIDRALSGTEQLLEAARRISASVRSSVLDDIGLEAALNSCGEDFERRFGLAVDVDVDFREDEIADTIAESTYRIVQEALTNVTRHSKTNSASVRIRQDAGQLRVTVRDDGVGFDATHVAPERLGLLGMRERAELLGGEFSIESAPSRGSTVYVTLPITREVREESPR